MKPVESERRPSVDIVRADLQIYPFIAQLKLRWSIMKICVLPTQYTFVFCMILSVNTHYIHNHSLICLYNGQAQSSLWGTKWILHLTEINQPRAQPLPCDAFSNNQLPSPYLLNFTTIYIASNLSLQEGWAGIAIRTVFFAVARNKCMPFPTFRVHLLILFGEF